MMTGKEIRESFLDFFAKRGHTIVKSSSLVPEKDPTLLFTNAGMVQFKNIFLGVERPTFGRAASAQKCLRISGKHNDLESVGRDTYHHTLFEMLGNWSFGDYYKEDAISWAWELLTEKWRLPKEKLYATVFQDDDEAEELWLKLGSLPRERILRFGEKDNFWEMGETGPCGPCSEIHLDRGPKACDLKKDPSHRCEVNAGCARFIELWNLVFIQYNRDASGHLEELPAKHVDTGMGLERITAVMQGVLSDYDVDLLRAIIAATENLTDVRYGEDPEQAVSFRVIADHTRAVSFLIADGVLPSNDGRGYVLRRLLRRAARHGRLLGFKEPFIFALVPTVADVLGDAYEELRTEGSRIQEVIKGEETRFVETLEKGLILLEDSLAALRRNGESTLPGDVAFRLYDTYGFPLDLTEDILRGEGLSVDSRGFERFMHEQRTRAREARESVATTAPVNVDYETHFLGYDCCDLDSNVLAIYRDSEGLREATEGDHIDLIVGDTPFYGESGGQVGDRGVIETARGDVMAVVDTQHLTPTVIVHRGEIVKGRIQVGDNVALHVDGSHRKRTTLNHSATHVLHAVLREELGNGVRQAGSLVAPDRLRFDFTHSGAIPGERLASIEQKVNDRVRQNDRVTTDEMAFDDAIRAGALAFFGDKYGDRVRVVRIGDFSTELCGGTHIHQAGEIGLFKLYAESGVAAGVRRVEALTGEGALAVVRKYDEILSEIAALVRATPTEATDRVRKLLEQQKQLERQVQQLRAQLDQNRIPDLLAKRGQTPDGATIIVAKVEGMDAKQLREAADQLKAEIGSGLIFLASASADNVVLVSAATKDLESRYHAGNLIKQVAPIVGGGGGGRADFAQAGGKDPAKTDAALAKVREILQQPISP